MLLYLLILWSEVERRKTMKREKKTKVLIFFHLYTKKLLEDQAMFGNWKKRGRKTSKLKLESKLRQQTIFQKLVK